MYIIPFVHVFRNISEAFIILVLKVFICL